VQDVEAAEVPVHADSPVEAGPKATEARKPEPSPAVELHADAGPSGQMNLGWLRENWGPLLAAVRQRSRPVEALLKSCEPLAVEGDLVVLGFYHRFHKDRVGEDKNRRVVEEALEELWGSPFRIQCKLYEGNAEARERETADSRREKLLDNPMVNEAVKRYGARVIDVQ
jgi:hypothetical protein